MTMRTPREIADTLSRKAIAARVGVGLKAVSMAVNGDDPKFPASWYKAIKGLADRRGMDLPMSAFSFKVVADDAPAQTSSGSSIQLATK